ncbi:hypothetical protein H4R19_002903 [Coemansia spiralis]|nr:hypothetical protein H4R19_002903 [Coemansia spiralis]
MAEEQARPAAHSVPGDADPAFGGDDDDDGFGSFDEGDGSVAAGSNDDDFGDFGDAGTPAPAPTAGTAPAHGLLDSTLARLDALLSRSPGGGDSRLEALGECLDCVFGSVAAGQAAPAVCEAPEWLLSEDAVQRAVAGRPSSDAPASAEPRLLRNLILVALSGDLAATDKAHLLTPSAELARQTAEAEASAQQESAPLTIDQIRLAAAQDEPGADQAAMLRRALASIELLTAAKKQEVVKRKDAIDVYNQVIQALVVQASKLH